MTKTTHTEAAEPAGWRANHIEETIRSVARLHANITRAPRRFSGPSMYNSFARPPPIHRRADRHRGRLDQPESARRRAWLSPY